MSLLVNLMKSFAPERFEGAPGFRGPKSYGIKTCGINLMQIFLDSSNGSFLIPDKIDATSIKWENG